LIAYCPAAFDEASQVTLTQLFPDAIRVGDEDAHRFALNSLSDGERVFCAAEAVDFARQVAERGFAPVPLEMAEFRLSGGGIKCCTQELRW
jgi:N-dimethylarginine dimethylaminohydrolase